MKDLAPQIIRQRLLIEGYYRINVDESVIKRYYAEVTKRLELKTYGEPIIHSPSGVGKEINQGYDAFVPLIDSGIYVGAWTNQRFLSVVIYTCKKFDVRTALSVTKKFWKIGRIESRSF